MKTLAYYVSNTGFGHITRSLAIIEHILEASDYSIYLACGKDQIEYSKVFYRIILGVSHTMLLQLKLEQR